VSSVALAVFSVAYAVITDYRVMLTLVLVHGVFWSGLLSASAAYMTGLLPENRRAEGIGYWGSRRCPRSLLHRRLALDLSQRRLAVAVCWSDRTERRHGGNCASLPEHPIQPAATHPRRRRLIELRVLLVSITLAMYSFGYGGITSFTAMYADVNGVAPKSLYLTALAIVMLFTRPPLARIGDRYGYRRVFVPCLVLICCGLAVWRSAARASGCSSRRSYSALVSAAPIRRTSDT
jgi:MFS family permease